MTNFSNHFQNTLSDLNQCDGILEDILSDELLEEGHSNIKQHHVIENREREAAMELLRSAAKIVARFCSGREALCEFALEEWDKDVRDKLNAACDRVIAFCTVEDEELDRQFAAANPKQYDPDARVSVKCCNCEKESVGYFDGEPWCADCYRRRPSPVEAGLNND